MPEGDTIFRAARTLHRALSGRTVIAFESVLPALMRVHDDRPITGRTVEGVTAMGKHLLITFSGGLVLRTHMRMNGSWHIYRQGERWQRPRRDMRVVIGTGTFVAVGFNIPVAEFVPAGRLGKHRELARLGPDLLATEFDLAEALTRLRAHSTEAIADVLLNQRVVAGVGNVYKSEILFAAGINPWTTIAALDDAALVSVLDTARKVLRANVSERASASLTGRNTTGRMNPSERLWVYGRGGKPCRKCGKLISGRKHGIDARLTYWCERCQP